MAQSTQRVVSDGTLVLLDLSINYLDRSEITVYFDEVLTTAWAWVGGTAKQITFSHAVPNGVEVLVKRTTDISKLRHEFSKGAAFTAEVLDEGLTQVLHIAQEAYEDNLALPELVIPDGYVTPPKLSAGAPEWDASGNLKSKASVSTGLQQRPGQHGSTWKSDYHMGWNTVCVDKIAGAYQPTEWQVYSGAAAGIAQVVAGTNQVVRVSGTAFDTSWVGLPYFYYAGARYEVLAVLDADTLTVRNTNGTAVSWGATAQNTFYFVNTSVFATASVSGSTVTHVSGQLFIPFCDFLFVNGVRRYIAEFVSPTELRLTESIGTLTGATIRQHVSIANQCSNLRLQMMAGENEENCVITAAPYGYTFQSSYAGLGKYLPVWISTGEVSPGSPGYHIGCHPGPTIGSNGWLTLGGDNGWQAMLVEQRAASVNYLRVSGGAIGQRVSIASRGQDGSPGMNFDTQNNGDFLFTSGNFGRTNFRVFGSSGTSYLAVDASASNTPSLQAIGGTNSYIRVAGNGNGGVTLTTGSNVSRVIVDDVAGVRLVPLPSAVPANNGELTVQATSNTQLTFRMRGSDGVVRSATLNLT